MKKLIFIFAILLSLNTSAQVIEVGIFTYKNVKSAMLIAKEGNYTIYGDGIRISELQEFEGFRAEYEDNKIRLRTMEHDYGSYASVEIRAGSDESALSIKSITPRSDEHIYNNHILIKPVYGSIQMINKVNIENYVAGVVEAETGKDRPFEFYKVQSIISRTYALANFRRHEEEGFQLCDQVHCQVYHGKSRWEEDIPKAVVSTKGLVIVDADIDLITAAFSSNCGGRTRNAEDVWSKEVSYLKSRVDSFCFAGKHAKWEKSIGKSEWESYKQKNQHEPLRASNGKGSIVMDNSYSEFLYHKEDLKAIRKHFKLKSTRFVIEENGDDIMFIGRGFGHGVGLCQEGAIHKAAAGIDYATILNSYYTDIHIIKLEQLNFFQSE